MRGAFEQPATNLSRYRVSFDSTDRDTTRFLTPQAGDRNFNQAENRLELYDGTDWVVDGYLGEWPTWNCLIYSGAVQWVALNNGSIVARYNVKGGRYLSFRITMTMGTTSAWGGLVALISWTLPFALRAANRPAGTFHCLGAGVRSNNFGRTWATDGSRILAVNAGDAGYTPGNIPAVNGNYIEFVGADLELAAKVIAT